MVFKRGQKKLGKTIWEVSEEDIKSYVKEVLSKKEGNIEIFYDSIMKSLFYGDGLGNEYDQYTVKLGEIEQENKELHIKAMLDLLGKIKKLTPSEIGQLRGRK